MAHHDDPDPATTIRRLVEGYQVSQAIHVAVTLRIGDMLTGGSRTSDDLAESTGTDRSALYRLLRALASVDILRELGGRRFELTSLGERLRSDVPDSIAGWAAFIGRPYYWQAWAGLLHSVRTGENAFRHVHGTDVWSYRSTRPDESAIFDDAMTSLSRRSNAALLAGYDFGRFRTIVDVGGGKGALLAAVLAAYGDLMGVLFDQPHVVADAAPLLERAGVADRCRIVPGSFSLCARICADAGPNAGEEMTRGIGSGSGTPPAVTTHHGKEGADARGDRITHPAAAWVWSVSVGGHGRDQPAAAVGAADGPRAGLSLWGLWAGGAGPAQLERAAVGGPQEVRRFEQGTDDHDVALARAVFRVSSAAWRR